MDEVVDCSTAALHLMARDPYNRLIMRQLNVIPTFIQVSSLAHITHAMLFLLFFSSCTHSTKEYSVDQLEH